ncbi:CTP synthase [Bifidobacterium samirii]|uniref:CTP synthase n=1 Tax=Bifidobacterium samirii TaxID=2306974 RepID=A0A430FW63_9BIFI|nr:CTP synthase [Bifidobacterium samirii]RSX58117.1 hypothetical protein D2E24_0477 [Bifidobacterium samirii]
MRTHDALEYLFVQAELEQRCAFTHEPNLQRALQRRAIAGDLVRPHRGVYARVGYWASLNPAERRLHVIRALALRNPERVFADVDAAATFGLEQSWTLLGRTPVHVLGPPRSYGNIRCVWPADHDVCEVRNAGTDAVTVRRRPDDGPAPEPGTILVTSPASTLVMCGLRLPFARALPLFDSALRKGLVSREEIVAAAQSHHGPRDGLLRLARCADPLSENGGESWLRGLILDDRFVVPELQCEFVDPVTGIRYRVDFAWRLPNSDRVVLEYDGAGKYVDPTMTGGRDIREIVHAERQREAVLRNAHVTTILRANYDDVLRWYPLRQRLIEAGVPRMDVPDVRLAQ